MTTPLSRFRDSTRLKHDESHEQPFKSIGRKILAKGSTPSINATSTDNKIDSAVSGIKAELRIQTYFINSLLEILHQTALNRGKTNMQGSQAPKGFQAAHACLAPRTNDTRTLELIDRIVKAGLTPIKTRPFLEERICLTHEDAIQLDNKHGDKEFVSDFITQRLPTDGIHSILSDTRYNWNCNATFENPNESNEYDSCMEKTILKFLDELQVDRLKGTDTAEESTKRLVTWLMDYYKNSITNLKQRKIDLEETSSSFERMRKFELGHLDAEKIPEDDFNAYLKDLELFLKNYEALIEKKVGCPSIKDIKYIRNDFKFLRKLHSNVEKDSPVEEITSIYLSTRHLSQEMVFDKERFMQKYSLYQEEAKAQKTSVKVFTEACTIPYMQTALFGKIDASGKRQAPTDAELKQQLLSLSMLATPVRAKMAKRNKLKPVPYLTPERRAFTSSANNLLKRKSTVQDHPDSPMKKKLKPMIAITK